VAGQKTRVRWLFILNSGGVGQAWIGLYALPTTETEINIRKETPIRTFSNLLEISEVIRRTEPRTGRIMITDLCEGTFEFDSIGLPPGRYVFGWNIGHSGNLSAPIQITTGKEQGDIIFIIFISLFLLTRVCNAEKLYSYGYWDPPNYIQSLGMGLGIRRQRLNIVGHWLGRPKVTQVSSVNESVLILTSDDRVFGWVRVLRLRSLQLYN
jgi:hypothetical protein